ncbi:hypothetical protein [Natrinema halophilum]|uniref:HAD family hydrolase n=1 Tax=Natrinema halophilum TaxID=1699371 RepID=A0A7D5GLN0_9EURY|nr:hypothetical protein [Natrinema halophilum]QLG47833.1 hypothetical protein HYG82_02715 [Natrinema halophilum]
MYDAAVFDVDGVLLRRHPNYPDVYRSVVEGTFQAFDVVSDESDVEAFVGGESKTLEGMRAVCNCYGLHFESFWEERERQSTALQRRLLEQGERTPYEAIVRMIG